MAYYCPIGYKVLWLAGMHSCLVVFVVSAAAAGACRSLRSSIYIYLLFIVSLVSHSKLASNRLSRSSVFHVAAVDNNGNESAHVCVDGLNKRICIIVIW